MSDAAVDDVDENATIVWAAQHDEDRGWPARILSRDADTVTFRPWDADGRVLESQTVDATSWIFVPMAKFVTDAERWKKTSWVVVHLGGYYRLGTLVHDVAGGEPALLVQSHGFDVGEQRIIGTVRTVPQIMMTPAIDVIQSMTAG